MKRALFFGLLFLVSAALRAQDSFDEKLTSVSNVKLTINNVGTFGNAFRGSYDLLDYPSCEYPANSGIEHLFEAGIWVGGILDGSLQTVSTAAYDQTSGYGPGRAGYEFTSDVGKEFQLRSTLIDNPNFSIDAISHQDFVADFSDKNILVPGTQTQISKHSNPLFIDVHFESYNWNYSFSDFMVICDYTITNNGTSTIEDVYVGMWSNEVIRNTNITPAGSGGSDFYDDGGNGFIDSLNMAYCFDATGDVGFTDSYIGHKFLGAEDKNGFRHPSIDPSIKANYQAWQFNTTTQPLFFFPESDNDQYAKMSTGLNHLPCWDVSGNADSPCNLFPNATIQQVLQEPGNRSDLLSVGPFESLAPGETITFAWAWVFAKKSEDGNPNAANTKAQKAQFIQNAQWAQTAYNGEDANFNGILDEGEDLDGDGEITRYILPSPPEIPKTRIVARDKGIDIFWSNNAETTVDPITQEIDFEGYNVFISELGFDVSSSANLSEDLRLLSSYDLEGNGKFYDTGLGAIQLEEPIKFENDENTYSYKKSIDDLVNGWQYAVAVTAFDRGDEASKLDPLESSKLSNTFAVFPGTEINEKYDEYGGGFSSLKAALNSDLADSLDKYKPFAYPNPYYGGASWEGNSAFEEDKKLTFANLPKSCIIRIFTISGDLVKTIEHNDSYSGDQLRWFSTYSNPDNTVFSGGEHSWDLLSDNAQIIARGAYIFSVEDLESGIFWKEKFVVIK